MGRIVSVVSGKGGAGKSTVAAGLARGLVQMGKRVLLVDTDGGICSAELLTEQGSAAVYNSVDVLEGVVTFEQAVVSAEGSPDFLAAPKTPFLPAQTEDLAKLLMRLVDEYDYIIADRPAGLDFTLEQSLTDCIGLVVSSPDNLCVRGASLAKEGLQAAGQAQIYLLLNRFLPAMIQYKIMPDIDTLCDKVGAQLIGIVPEDGTVLLDGAKGKFSVNAPYNKALCRIAQRLTGEQVPLPKLKKLLK